METVKLQKKLDKRFGAGKVAASRDGGITTLTGELGDLDEVLSACYLAVSRKKGSHVVNDIRCPGFEQPPMKLPKLSDAALEGERPDVLVIGGGISGASIARELTKNKLSVLLVEKESDLAMQASGRNDGEVHPGIDLGRGTLKQHYVILGNEMYGRVCGELEVPFRRCGQYVGFTQGLLLPLMFLFALQRRYICGVKGARIIGRKALRRAEPNLNPKFRFALYTPTAGCVCPYGLTIAYAENAVTNGARVSLNTAVLGMELDNGVIKSVRTNRGTVYPRVVINAAGVFAEDIARMADDRFYSIHPRRGTNSILDKKANALVNSISSIKRITRSKAHTKGGGILRTADDNLLVGPNAVETSERENFSTLRGDVDAVFAKQSGTAPGLSQRDIITCFTGVRAPTFEEDFVIEKGRRCKNLIHCAGIQSPGLTTAPAAALDVEKMALELLGGAERNENFDPHRRGIPNLRELPREERDALIKKNPAYGEMVCRCEEISRGEIIDALERPIKVPTIDGIKKRVRPGMGRCQGGFCMPLVAEIIARHEGIPLFEVQKSGDGSPVVFGPTKGGAK